MKLITFAILLVLVLSQTDSEWDEYKAKFNKAYSSVEDEASHRAIWNTEKARIDEENAKGHSYTLSLNQFSDMTAAEKDSKIYL
jgi:hypothetical protein